MQEEKCVKDSSLVIDSRKTVTVSGVKNILGFGEDYVTLDTECGRLEIEGEEMRIEELCREDSKVYIRGRINGIIYSEQKQRLSPFRKTKK